MAGYRIVLILLFLVPAHLFGQVNRYVVFFTDKSTTPYTIDQPAQFLTAKAIERRAKQGIVVTDEDLPVNPSYVEIVRGTGARTFFASRWMNCLLVEIGADSLDHLTELPFVAGVEYVAPGHRLSGGRKANVKNRNMISSEPASQAQVNQLGIDEMHSRGYHGENMTIAVLDGGFTGVNSALPFAHLFQSGRIKGSYDFVGNSGNVYQYDEHGTEVLSLIGAKVDGSFTGGAPMASFYLYVTEDGSSEYRIEEYNWLWAAERADSVGVDIISSSLGYYGFDDPTMDYQKSELNGEVAVVTKAATFALHRGIVVVCSAGNEGNLPWMLITPPSDADGILSCGAVDLNGERVPFSSVGPTADMRIKPDVSALGYGDTVILPDGSIGSRNGTSFACPLVASLAAGVWQAFPNLTATEVYDAIIHSADQAKNPDNKKGYGIPNFIAVANYLDKAGSEVAEITLYPNPVAQNTLHVQLREPADGLLTVIIYDQLGRILSKSTIQSSWVNNPIQINVGNMSAGLYLLKIISPSLAKTFRWMKQ